MTARRSRPHRPRVAGLLGILLVATSAPGCSSGDDATVTIFGPETDQELANLQAVFAEFSEETGIAVEVQGSRGFEGEIGSRIAAGDPPDIAMFPQPSRVVELRDELEPLPARVQESIAADFAGDLVDLVRRDPDGPATAANPPLAVPTKTDLKSLVWYNPRAFAELGYEVPTSFEDLLALADRMAAEGHPPFCLGLASGVASGWPATDWIEEFLLRVAGPDVYDAWLGHDIPFDDPQVVSVAQMVFDRWSQPGYVFGGIEAAAVTNFQHAGWPMLDGECMMHRQANFYRSYLPRDAEIGPDGNVNAFRLPGSAQFGNVLLTGGLYAAPFGRGDDVERVVEFLASAEFANAMADQSTGGFLSPHRQVDVELYPDDLTRDFGETLLLDTNEVRFDASDQMPSAVGSGTFWTAMLDIALESAEVPTVFTEVEASWPS